MRVFVLMVLAIAFVGCHDATAPVARAGQYALVSVNGFPLPFVAASDTIRSGAVDLGVDGKYNSTLCRSQEGPPCWVSPYAIFKGDTFSRGTYRIRGDTLVLSDFRGTGVRYLVADGTHARMTEVYAAGLTFVFEWHSESP